MKIKLDFVTNSSSACFLMSIPKEEVHELMNSISAYNDLSEATNEGVRCYFSADTLKSLQEYTNDGALDWASLPGGPQFIRMSESNYEECKAEIEKGCSVAEVWVDYNVCERFTDEWKDEIIMENS